MVETVNGAQESRDPDPAALAACQLALQPGGDATRALDHLIDHVPVEDRPAMIESVTLHREIVVAS